MRRKKFIFLNVIIIVFMTAQLAVAVNVQKTLTGASSAAKATEAAANVPAQDKAQPVQNKTQPVSAPNATTVPSAAPNATLIPTSVEAYNYNPSGKPDPFRPFIVIETPGEKKVVKKQPLSIFPLQRAETGNYRLVGIAGDEDHRVAIVEDAGKKFYPLFKGTRIGLRNGRVVEIMADRVIVEEYEGKKTKRVILKLRKN